MFNKKKEEKETKNKNCEYKFASKKDGDCCRLKPVYDPDTGEMLGCLACEIISDEECKKSRIKTATRIDSIETIQHETIHAEAESIVEPLKMDEVSAAFIANLRVTSWENLGEMYGGHKLGKIYSYILSVLNEKIEESTAATIKIEAPLYEQYSTVEPRKETSEDFLNDEKECMYCKEAGIKNKNVFVEVSDPELGIGWICKECFLEADKEQKEELARLDLKVSKLEKVLEDIKRSLVVETPFLPIRPLNKFLINKMRMIKAKIEKGLEDEE